MQSRYFQEMDLNKLKVLLKVTSLISGRTHINSYG